MFKQNIVILILGKLVSLFGSKVFSFALSFLILKETGSALQFTLSLALNYIPSIFLSPIAGSMVDLWSPKWIIITCDLLSGTVIFMLLLFPSSLIPFYIAIVLLSAIASVIHVTFDAATPRLEGISNPSQLKHINAAMQLITSISVIVAPILSGFFITVEAIWKFLLFSGTCFWISALSELFLKFRHSVRTERDVLLDGDRLVNFFTDYRDTLRYIMKNRLMKSILLSDSVLNFFFSAGLNATLSFVLLQFLGMDAWQYGLISGILAGGSVFATITLFRRSKNTPHHKYPFHLVMIMAICLLAYAMLVWIGEHELLEQNWLFGALMVIVASFGFVVVYINVPVSTAVQVICPEQMRGKVFGLLRMLSYALIPFAMLLSGIILEHTAPWRHILLCGLGLMISTLILWSQTRKDNDMIGKVR